MSTIEATNSSSPILPDRLCRVPQYVAFEYYPEQQMHAYVQIQNLKDDIVSFKIKTNAPNYYLVKPMQGQIYNQEKMKIVFKRKRITKQTFESSIGEGAKLLKDKFMFTLTCTSKNAIGIVKTKEEVEYMNVRFIHPKKVVDRRDSPSVSAIGLGMESRSGTGSGFGSGSPKKNTTVKKVKSIEQRRQQANMLNNVKIERVKLLALQTERQSEERRLEQLVREGSSSANTQLTLQNIICLLIIAFVLGLAL